MKYIYLVLLVIFFHAPVAYSSPQKALDAERAGDHQKAITIFSELAKSGDDRAMIHLGNKYYSGDGVAVDYKQAMDWWLKAFAAENGDAPGNIGVLFRDGKGVKKNRKIAYVLFLYTHMVGLGTESTQIRVNTNLRREMIELSKPEIEEALCYSMEYVFAYVNSRGTLKNIPDNALPTDGAVRIKDNSWWLESERKDLTFSCPKPWSKS
jgi:hypothetical protein